MRRDPDDDDLPNDPPAIAARGLVREYAGARALDGLDLEVRRGECFGLLGPNGAGKTTTIRILSTLDAATSGEARVLGLDPRADARQLRARIGVVPQELALYEDLSGCENLRFFGRLYGVERRRLEERVERALEWSGLAERAGSRVSTWSGGMKRRLNLVAALMHEPELVFLDEPTVGIDPQSRNRLFEMVEDLRARGVTLIYTTHQLGEVERLCERALILDRGRAIAAGTLAELRRAAGGARGRARLTVGDRADDARALLETHGIPCALEEQELALEDVFLALTGRALRDER